MEFDIVKNLDEIVMGDVVEIKYIYWKKFSPYICICESENFRVFAFLYKNDSPSPISHLHLSQNYTGDINNQPGCHFKFYDIFTKRNKENYKGMRYYHKGLKTI